MDWKVFTAAFAAIFLAEMADKTQLVGITMAAKTGKPVSVLVGSVCAYIIVTLISVIVGTVLAKFIKPEVLRSVAAVLFVILGILMFFDKI